jgi:tetratricopeptide (TPR) repeat protein
MSDSQVQYFVNLFKQIEMPTSKTITEEGRELFERGCDTLLMYRGHPDTLMQALRLFLASDTRPYVLTGMALILDHASYISGGKYEPDGIRIALQRLAEAQDIAPFRFEINIIEPGIYGNLNDIERMREQLDTLRSNSEARTSFRYAITEMWYWEKKNDLSMVVRWNETAFKNAANNVQRLFALNALAGIYLRKDYNEEALELYHEVVKINPGDPWAWHNMSIIYFEQQDYTNAGKCNDRALRTMDFEAARNIQRSLVKVWSKNRHADVLHEIPPYKVVQSNQRENNPFLKRLLKS